MPPCHGGDRQFKSDPGRHCGSSSVVEHNLAKVGVAGSSPVFRSIWRHSQAVRQRSAKPLSPVRFRVPPPGREKRRLKKSAFSSIFFHAGVAELADAGDLKSPEGNASYRFEPGPRHQKIRTDTVEIVAVRIFYFDFSRQNFSVFPCFLPQIGCDSGFLRKATFCMLTIG